jgi:hypothetical protein
MKALARDSRRYVKPKRFKIKIINAAIVEPYFKKCWKIVENPFALNQQPKNLMLSYESVNKGGNFNRAMGAPLLTSVNLSRASSISHGYENFKQSLRCPFSWLLTLHQVDL